MNHSSSVVAIIGAGPAGLSAALWLKNLGLNPVVLEQSSVTGGMLNVNFLSNDWVLGQAGVTGPDMAVRYNQHIAEKAIDLRTHTQIQHMVRDTSNEFLLTLLSANDTARLVCAAVLVATGTRYVDRHILPRAVIDVAASRIVEGPYAFADIEQQKNKTIVIVGAGDNAFENAAMLLDQGCQVSIIARSVPRAQRKFIDKVSAHSRATIIEYATVESAAVLEQTARLQLHVRSGAGSEAALAEINNVDTIHVLAGYQPNSELLVRYITEGLQEPLICDDQGFLCVDRFGRTNIQGVYAAGDICNTDFPSVVSAVSGGALAAKTISHDIMG